MNRAAATILLTCCLSACGPTTETSAEKASQQQRDKALTQRLKAACSSQGTYDRLKQVAFDEAIRIRNADPVNLDKLSTYSLVRVENPIVKSRDEALDVTVCSGRFILQIPPGAEVAFDGKRQLVADIEYAAQAAADGSGLVYQIKGAEPIIYRLAAFDLKSAAYRRDVAVAVEPDGARRPISSPQDRPRSLATPSARPTQPARADRDLPTPPAGAIPREATQTAARTAPSFNCRAGRSRSEQMVCNSDRLASLDRQMSALFYSALSRSDGRARSQLRRTRDAFLGYRERCPDQQCVEQAYLDRMDEIRDIAAL